MNIYYIFIICYTPVAGRRGPRMSTRSGCAPRYCSQIRRHRAHSRRVEPSNRQTAGPPPVRRRRSRDDGLITAEGPSKLGPVPSRNCRWILRRWYRLLRNIFAVSSYRIQGHNMIMLSIKFPSSSSLGVVRPWCAIHVNPAPASWSVADRVAARKCRSVKNGGQLSWSFS